MNYTKYLVSFLIVIMIIGCSDLSNVDEIEFEGSQREYAIPLINTKVSLIDVFDGKETGETDLIVHPDSSLSLLYSGDVLKQVASDIFPPVPGGLPILISSKMDTIPLPFSRLILIQADLTGDTLVFGIVSNETEDIRVKITVPSLLKDGAPLVIEEVVEYDPNGQLPTQKTIYTRMDGLILRLYENQLIVNYEAWNEAGDVIDVDQVVLIYDEMTYSYLEGFFSKNDVDIPGDEIELDIYDNWIDGRLYFAEPKVIVTVDNSFGFPVRADIKYLRVVGRNGQKVDLESPINDQIDFLYPKLDEIGQVKTNIIRYDETNSNIEDILNIQPVILEYDINAVANPDRDSTIIGFMTDSSFIRINVTVELLVKGWANEFSARDTLEFDIDSISGAEEVEFKLVLDNGMPVTLSTQLYFVDEDYRILDSLFHDAELEVEGAAINGDGRAIGSIRTIDFETMDENRLNLIASAKHAIFDVSFLTKNAPNQIVSIDANDVISIKMGAKIKLK